ncbi:MAG: hypothetical protein KJ638_04985, partial [Chloroflexi bacterium]|nr:hypothetical protein [Chloroflexota bacterium]
MRISWLSNAPWASSGYGNQTRIFIQRIKDLGHEPSVISLWGLEGGILNWNGIPVYPKGVGQWSNDIAAAHAVHWKADVMISLFDTWPMNPDQVQQHGVRWIPWFPIDMDPIPPPVARNVSKAFDRIVFSRFGQRKTEDAGLT